MNVGEEKMVKAETYKSCAQEWQLSLPINLYLHVQNVRASIMENYESAPNHMVAPNTQVLSSTKFNRVFT